MSHSGDPAPNVPNSWEDKSDVELIADENVFDDVKNAEEWASKRGLPIPQAEDSGINAELVFSCIPHDESATAAWTSALLNTSTAAVLGARAHFHIPSPPPMFEIRPITEDGREPGDCGIFATANIDPGTVLIVERPALLVPAVFSLSNIASSQSEIFRTLFHRLPPPVRDAMYALQNRKPEQVCSTEVGIVRTNGIAVELPSEGSQSRYSGVFPAVSRCNHSCSPNACISWDSQTLSIKLSTVRAIEKDHEITMTYIDPLANRATRRAQLLAAYDFTCQCEACRGPSKPKELQKSDNRREKLATWSRTPVINRLTPERWLAGQEVEAISYNTGKISKTMSSKLFLGAMTELMGALQSERLEILRAIHMEVADALVRTHAIFGDRQVIQQALKTAIEVWSVDSTHSSIARRRIETYRKWSHDVTVVPHWNKKKL